MSNVALHRFLETAQAWPFALSTRIARLLHWAGIQQSVRNARWRARLGTLGPGSLIHKHVVIHCPEKLTIGAHCAISDFVHIWAAGGVSVGDNVIIASHVVLTSLSHDIEAKVFRNSSTRAPISIKDNVWIGSGAIILPGVTIGSGSVVGAGAVVTRNIPERSVVTGVPARVTKSLPVPVGGE